MARYSISVVDTSVGTCLGQGPGVKKKAKKITPPGIIIMKRNAREELYTVQYRVSSRPVNAKSAASESFKRKLVRGHMRLRAKLALLPVGWSDFFYRTEDGTRLKVCYYFTSPNPKFRYARTALAHQSFDFFNL